MIPIMVNHESQSAFHVGSIIPKSGEIGDYLAVIFKPEHAPTHDEMFAIFGTPAFTVVQRDSNGRILEARIWEFGLLRQDK